MTRQMWMLCFGIAVLAAPLSARSASASPRGKRLPRIVSTEGGSSVTEVQSPLVDSPQMTRGDGVGRPDAQCRPPRERLTYHGGDLVPQPGVFVIFWGTEWQTDPEHINAAAAVRALYQQIGTSTYACTWAESGVTAMPFATGSYLGDEIIASAPPSPLPDATIQQRIVTEVNASRAPARTDSVVYVVMPPRGVPVDAGGSTGCGGSNFVFCAYHDSFAQAGRYRYAVLPYPCTDGFGTCFVDPTNDPGKAVQVSGSHELAELVTDPDSPPVGAGGWFSDRSGNENADICAADSCVGDVTVGPQTFSVNSLWSNLAGGCVFSVPCPSPPVTCTETSPGECVRGTTVANTCSFEWLVYPNMTQRAGLPSRSVACADGQPFCDFDGAQDGRCTFHVAACLNNDDPRLQCTPTGVTDLKLTQPSPASSNPDNVANATALLGALSDVDSASVGTVSGAAVSYSPAAATHNACINYLTITVPLRTVGGRLRSGNRMLAVTVHSLTGTARNHLLLTCQPPQS